MSIYNNIILNTDSYKASHWLQYPDGTEYVSSYIEPRGSKNPLLNKVVFFGLQAFIKQYLLTPVTKANIDKAERLFARHGEPFNRSGWEYILNTHKGKLPIEIEALEEGTILPLSNCLVQVINTDPKNCFWLTSYIESALLRAVWYPSTVASLAYACREHIKKGMLESCDNLDGLPFKLNDFGLRGVSSAESSGLGGMGFLLFFLGTDNLNAVLSAEHYYNQPEDQPVGFSIPAAEHSTITSWTRAKETEAYSNMIKQYGSEGSLFAVVSDSYDVYNAVANIWGDALKQQLIDCGGTLVVRPDSGDPVEVLLGKTFQYTVLNTADDLKAFINDCSQDDTFKYQDKYYTVTGKDDFINEYGDRIFDCLADPSIEKFEDYQYVTEDFIDDTSLESKGLFKIIEERFGCTINSKGYKVFPNNIRLIQGDGINVNSIPQIVAAVLSAGYSLDNIVFGMGGGLLQQVNRDTFNWAMKCSAITVNGEWRDVQKDPITSSAKKSKVGRLAVIKENQTFKTIRLDQLNDRENLLKPVYINGDLLKDLNYGDVRNFALSQ